MKRKINIIEAAMKFPQVPIAITVIMVLAGLISLMTMPRSEDPRVTVRQGLVVAFYPGSDEVQMEKEVTDKLEQYLFGFEEIAAMGMPKRRVWATISCNSDVSPELEINKQKSAAVTMPRSPWLASGA